jgi:hypothetical protein
MDGEQSSTPLTLQIDPSAQRRPRPVLVAAVCVALLFGIGLYRWAFTVHWWELTASLLYLGFAFVFFLFVRALYRGGRLARGFIIWFGGISLLSLPFTWRRQPTDSLFAIQVVLQTLAVILLLLPSSRSWFSQPRKSP